MPTLAAGTTTSSSSPRCVPFSFRRGGGSRGRLPAPTAPGGAPAGCGRPLCRAAGVVGGGIQGAFFASLDTCSCVELRTKSFKETEAAPLMSSLPPPHPRDSGSARGGRSNSSAGAGAGKGSGGRRRGLGCCTPTSTASVN